MGTHTASLYYWLGKYKGLRSHRRFEGLTFTEHPTQRQDHCGDRGGCTIRLGLLDYADQSIPRADDLVTARRALWVVHDSIVPSKQGFKGSQENLTVVLLRYSPRARSTLQNGNC